MSIKVLVISDFRMYHPARPEAELFMGLTKIGFNITIMTYSNSDYTPELKNAGIKVVEFHPEKKFNKAEISIIRKELIEGSYDILHLFNSKAIINGIRAAKRLPVKVVLYRGFAGHVHWYDPSSYLKYLNPGVDTIVCNSRGVEESIRRQLIINKKKAITILKGHRLEWYENYTPVNLNSEFNIPKNAFVVINVANYRPMKGIEYLLKAMDLLPEDAPIFLLLVGKNMDNPKISKVISNNRNKEKIILAGFRTDALNIVASCQLFVLSSVKGEGLNKAVIEAMSQGKPAIVTDIPGNRDLVDDNKNGFLIPPRDTKKMSESILFMYQNPERFSQMGINARKYVETKLNLDTAIVQHKELYEKLFRNKLS